MGEAPRSYLDTQQAAAVLGLSQRTLESYRVKGGGPPYLKCCNRIRYLRSDLDRWAVESRRRTTSGGKDARRGDARKARPLSGAPGGAVAPADEDWLSAGDLAALLGVNLRTLMRYRALGRGPGFETVDGEVRYARAEVERWLERGRRSSTRDAGGNSSAAPSDTSPDTGEDDR